MKETIASEVTAFIKKNFLFDEHAPLDERQSLLGTGVVDSTGALELINFLEKRFEVSFSDSELVMDNFDSVAKIAAFLESKRSGKTGATNE